MHRFCAALAALVMLLASTPLQAAGEDAGGPAGAVRWGYYVPYAADSYASLEAHIGEMNYVSPYWYRLNPDGTVNTDYEARDAHRAEVLRLAQQHGVAVVPMIKNIATYEAFTPVLTDPALRAAAIGGILDLTMSRGFRGINIDWESITASDRPALTAFMAELSAALRAQGKLVTQAIPAKDRDRTTGWAGAYDYAALAGSSDLLILMAYGYGTGRPQSTAPYPWVLASTTFAASQIPPAKLVLGIAWYGYDWNLTKGGVASKTYAEAVAAAQASGAGVEFDESVRSAHYTYATADGEEHEVWFEDARSAAARSAVVTRYGLAGVAGWRLGHEDPAVWPLLGAAAPAAPLPLSPADDVLLPGLEAPLSWSLPAGTTQYQLQVVPFGGDGPGVDLVRNAEPGFPVHAPVLGQGNYVLLPGMTYTWRLRTTAASVALAPGDPGWSEWSVPHRFRTPAPSSAGLSPVQPQPESTLRSGSVTVQWRDTAPGIFYYEVQMSPDPRFGEGGAVAPVWHNLVHGGLSNPLNSWTAPPLQPGTAYYWRVRPRVQGDGTPVAWGPAWGFRTP